MARLKLVYILGSGRCGSTILDAAIGTSPDAVSTGELDYFSRAVGAAKSGVHDSTLAACSCGVSVVECPLWSAVWPDFVDGKDLEAIDAYRARFERVLISLPFALASRLIRASSFMSHLANVQRLLEIISARSGATTIVDSSKNPTRGWIYTLLPADKFDVRFVHIVRDGRSVVKASLDHHRPDSITSAAPPGSQLAAAVYSSAYWSYMNLHGTFLGAINRERYIRISYEELLRNPRQVLSAVGNVTGIDLSLAAERASRGQKLDPGHILFGNRSKANPVLRVSSNPQDRARLPRTASMAFGLFGGWLEDFYHRHPIALGPP